MTPLPRKSTLGFCILVLSIACRPTPKNYLAHEWQGDGGKQIMIFDKDSTLKWIFHEETLSDTFFIHYKLNENTHPDQLDLYDFSSGILKGKILAGIVELHSPDSLLLDFEPGDTWEEADSIRPASFDPDQKRFFIRKK